MENERANRLHVLFNELQECKFQNEIKEIQANIWQVWLSHDDERIAAIISCGVTHLSNTRYTEAIATFTDAIELDPTFAEAWNKRATAYYLRGSFKESISDINQTLSLESRHFGALSGLATIYMELRDEPRALLVLKGLQNLLPHDRHLIEQIDSLQKQINATRNKS